MASFGWIAGTRDEAIKRIGQAAPRIAEAMGMDTLTLPLDRDKNYEQAVQLHAVAVWLEALADKLNPPAPTPVVELSSTDEITSSEAVEPTAEPAPTPRKGRK